MRDANFAEPLQQIDRVKVQVGRRKLLYFGGCDYHRLSSDASIVRAVHSSLDLDGLTTAASRKTTGNHRLFERVEKSAARCFGAQRAVLLSSGYLANIAVAQGIRETIDCAFIDERCHGSLLDALHFVGCPRVKFLHRDPRDLGTKIANSAASRILVVTDGIFAFDGSVAPLSAYRAITKALLWVDDAHAAGVLGPCGRGSIEAAGISRRNVIQTITFSKAFGLYGGAILCEEDLRRAVVSKSSAVAGNTPLPLPLAAGILKSLQVLKGSHLKKLRANVRLFWEKAQWQPENNSSPIIAVANAPLLSKALLAADIYPTLIHYPGGPAKGYFRFAISSVHTSEQVVRLAETIRRFGAIILSPSISR